MFGSAGSFVVTLTVVDSGGASDSISKTISVEAAPVVITGIELTAVGTKVKGVKQAELSWHGTEASSVRVLRDGVELVVVENSGLYRDQSVEKRAKSVTYQVCEVASLVCSDEVTVNF